MGVLKMKSGKASFQNYEKENEDVVGINWDVVNEARKQYGLPPLPYKTVRRGGEGKVYDLKPLTEEERKEFLNN